MRKLWLGALLFGISMILAGGAIFMSGKNVYEQVQKGLLAERLIVQNPAVLLTFEGAKAPADVKVENITIDTPEEAMLQAEVIYRHTMVSTNGATFTEIAKTDPDYDKKRETYRWGMAHRTALMLAGTAFGVSQLVMAIGGLTSAIGAGFTFFVAPALHRSESREN